MMRVVFAFVALASAVSAHVCMLSPIPRGGLPSGYDMKASVDCGWVTGPCGNDTIPGPIMGVAQVGRTFDVQVIKNLDHFNGDVTNPGNFAAAVAPKGSTDFQPWASTVDTAEPSLTLYTIGATVPSSLKPGDYTLQVTYNTKNSAAPPSFYACADITVLPAPSS